MTSDPGDVDGEHGLDEQREFVLAAFHDTGRVAEAIENAHTHGVDDPSLRPRSRSAVARKMWRLVLAGCHEYATVRQDLLGDQAGRLIEASKAMLTSENALPLVSVTFRR